MRKKVPLIADMPSSCYHLRDFSSCSPSEDNVTPDSPQKARAINRKRACSPCSTQQESVQKGEKKGHRLPKNFKSGHSSCSPSEDNVTPDSPQKARAIKRKRACSPCSTQQESVQKAKKIEYAHEPFTTIAKQLEAELQQRDSLAIFKLRNVKFEEGSLPALKDLLHRKEVKCPILNLSGNKNMDFRIVISIIRSTNAKEVDLGSCDISAEDLELLATSKLGLKKVDLSHNNLGTKAMTKSLASLIDSGVENLVLADCRLSKGHLKDMFHQLKSKPKKNMKLKNLNLMHNTNFGVEDYEALGTFLSAVYSMVALNLSGCEIDDEILAGLAKSITGTAKVSHLELSINTEISTDGMTHIASILQKCQVESLSMCNCQLKDRHLIALQNAFKASKSQVRSLQLRTNRKISGPVVASLACALQVKVLDLGDCKKRVEDLKEMEKTFGTYKIDELDLSEPYERMSKSTARELVKTIKKFVTCKLWLCYNEVPNKYRLLLEKEAKEHCENIQLLFERPAFLFHGV